jgi:outer membrane protein assembly factor BamB
MDHTLTSPNPQSGGGFGFAIAASSRIVVVGEVPETAGGQFLTGHAYIFDAHTGRLIRTLASPNDQSGGAFGGSVAAYGNIAVVGAVFETVNGQNNAGHAYEFNAETGALMSTLTSPNPQPQGSFGSAVAVTDSIIVVGALGEGGFAGRAYTFNPTTGSLIASLTSPNEQSEGLFGRAVAASGSVVVVGAPIETVGGHFNAGHAYAFDAETGTLVSTLTSPSPQSQDMFGTSVAAIGNTVVVGAPGYGLSQQSSAGYAYLFDARSGLFIGTVTSPNASPAGEFGYSIAARGNILVVGAPGETVNGRFGAGHAYAFNMDTSTLISVMASPNPQFGGVFGLSVATSSNIVAVGAPQETVNGDAYAGRTYTF